MQKNLLRLAAARVAVYCPHTAMDAAVGGITDWLCDMITADISGSRVTRTAIQGVAGPTPRGHEGAGYGRVMDLPRKVDLHTLLRRLVAFTTGTDHVTVALPQSVRDSDPSTPPMVGRIAACPGSGSGVFQLLPRREFTREGGHELLVTGEMSHHDALRHTAMGRIIAQVFHSNSERHYLVDVLQKRLVRELADTPYSSARVLVSVADRDPFEILSVSPLS